MLIPEVPKPGEEKVLKSKTKNYSVYERVIGVDWGDWKSEEQYTEVVWTCGENGR